MPSAFITLEYVTNKWVCEVEAQDRFLASRRRHIVAETIEDAIDQVYAAYRDVVPGEQPKVAAVPDVPLVATAEPVGGLRVVRRGDRNKSQRDSAPVPPVAESEPVAAPEPQPVLGAELAGLYDPANLDALRTEAEGLGVTVDKRWGEARLRREIEDRRG